MQLAGLEFCSIFIPGLPVATICSFVLTAEDLRSVACLCHEGSSHSQAAAEQQIERIQKRLDVTVSLRRSPRLQGQVTFISSLRRWESTAAAQRVWLDARSCTTRDDPDGVSRVQRVHDLSCNGMHAAPPTVVSGSPALNNNGLNRQPVLQFSRDGGVLQTQNFQTQLQTPVTYFLVAQAFGDVTLLDRGDADDERMELCHGCACPPSPTPLHLLKSPHKHAAAPILFAQTLPHSDHGSRWSVSRCGVR